MSERGRKRKATENDAPDSSAKRQKFQSVNSTEEVTELGLELVEHVKSAKDKSGRSVSDLFLTLPDRDELPDYYDVIELPIAVDTVEDKLQDREYESLTEVESDFKRMVANAKQYNDDQSEVFADAERVRKLLFNWMKTHNPAYKDPDYVAFPTPLPSEQARPSASKRHSRVSLRVSEGDAKQENVQPKRPTITLGKGRRTSEAQKKQPTASPAAEEKSFKPMSNDFKGKSFGQVQEQIMEDFIQYRDDDGMQIYFPFINLPSRSITDYYQLIKKPVCFKSIQKRARGQHGRDSPTGITDFKTWDAFEDEVSFIWKNAKDYNEDGSDMYNLAIDFEKHFKSRLAEVKTQVDEPQGTRIKLNARPKPVLHLGAKPTQNGAASPGIGIDSEALERQKQLVQAGMNGHQTPQPSQRSESSAAAEAPPAPPVIKAEPSMASPAPDTVRPVSSNGDPKSSMPPPRIPSNSPHPSLQQQPQPAAPVYVPSLAPTLATWSETFARTKPVSEALLPNIQLTSHPQLNTLKPFKVNIMASPEYIQQSITIMLPPSIYYLQASPVVSQQLSSGRQYKLFVTVNGVRVSPSMRPPTMNGDLHNGVEKRQAYDISLVAGVNRIEVEIVAVTGRGGSLEVEKTVIFANLMRH